MRTFLAEATGTFAIVFCGTGAIITDQQSGGAVTHAGVAITFGLIVMSMIHALGPVSGAHFNPAVTLAFTLAGRFNGRKIIPYIVSQLSGAMTASLLLRLIFPENQLLGATLPAGSDIQSFVLEFILTLLLMLVILQVSQGSKEQGMFAGITIGSVVLLEAMFAGPVCGASMNPFRSLAPATVSGHPEHLWIYLTAPVAGAASSVLLWKYLIRQ